MQNDETPWRLCEKKKNLDDLGFGDDFLDTVPKAWAMKEELISGVH